jgi:hypothetical protein
LNTVAWVQYAEEAIREYRDTGTINLSLFRDVWGIGIVVGVQVGIALSATVYLGRFSVGPWEG